MRENNDVKVSIFILGEYILFKIELYNMSGTLSLSALKVII